VWHARGFKAAERREADWAGPAAAPLGHVDQQAVQRLALLLLATSANLRSGELAGLRRNQIDLDACEVRVNTSTSEMDDWPLIDGRSGEVNRARSRGRALRRRRSGGRHPVTAHPNRRYQAVRVVDPLDATVDLREF
jgi:integrase